MTYRLTLEQELRAAVAEHDRQTRDLGIWLGAEPTFTDRTSEAPEWLSDAQGEDKERRARALIARLSARRPGGLVLRPLGRQYPRESAPRFCYGLYERRDGTPIWQGPPDRLLDGAPEAANQARVPAFSASLCQALVRAGCSAHEVTNAEGDAGRVLFRFDGQSAVHDAQLDPRLARCSVHALRVEGAGLIDDLAADGSYLLLVHAGAGGAEQPEHNELWVELPAFTQVADLTRALACLAEACAELELGSLGVRGFTPGVDASVAWTSITPDPAVLEINQAPYSDLGSFQRATEELFELAADIGLSPYRLQYNGAVFDSGGGGQLTFGGATPEQSPFFTCPVLLPRLIRYLVRHPSLSYWFATQYVGGSSQSPRPDEGARESFLELAVALEQLAQHEAPTPALLWGTLRHFLADASGNPHRSALNIEKLDNPFLPGRGRLGLVELRALAMARSPEIATARAMLLRGVLAMLMRDDRCPELMHWLDTLHDRFALPFYLEQDLREVFADLARAGLGLGAQLESSLLARSEGVLADVVLEDCRVRVEQALEFWPLVGDVAAQEAVSSRVVDASTSRIQVRVEALGAGRDVEALGAERGGLDAIEISVNGHRITPRDELGPNGAARVLGLRYRAFVPWTGLHPSMPAEGLIVLTVVHPSGRALRLTLHSWRPDGGAYPGLPVSLEDAHERRLARAVIERPSAADLPPALDPPASALTPYNLDLRRLHKPATSE